MKKWKCGVCGYVHNGDQAPVKCPVCGANQNRYKLLDIEVQKVVLPGKEPAENKASSQPIRKWRCQVCGYIHTGPEPPETCPVCGAPKSKFILVEEIESFVEAKKMDTIGDDSRSEPRVRQTPPAKTFDTTALFKKLSQLHAHPIAVHIPNGVLPLTVLFSLFAFIFNSPGFAMAAKYNMIFVCLAMPVVIFTGFVDWRIRFEQRMSKVFGTKMVCAGLVSFLSLIITIWWLVQPEVYLESLSKAGFFLFFNIVDLACAAVAGWYGGKLVFSNH